MKKLLIVEDDQLIQDLLLDILELEDYEVKIAGSAEAAKDTLENFQPDCMIIDVMLPGIGGDEFVTELRQDTSQLTPPIIMMSALSQSDSKARTTMADAFVKKPFEMEELLEVLNKLTCND